MKTNHNYILTGDLYDEQQLLSWLLVQKNPAGDVIEALEGQDLKDLIEEEPSLAVYFCKFLRILLLQYTTRDTNFIKK